jgi:hypothetical protein
MNAFDKDYIKTHYPDLLTEHILSSRGKITMAEVLEKKRAIKPTHGTIHGLSKKPVSLKPLEFMVYSRAGMPK